MQKWNKPELNTKHNFRYNYIIILDIGYDTSNTLEDNIKWVDITFHIISRFGAAKRFIKYPILET